MKIVPPYFVDLPELNDTMQAARREFSCSLAMRNVAGRTLRTLGEMSTLEHSMDPIPVLEQPDKLADEARSELDLRIRSARHKVSTSKRYEFASSFRMVRPTGQN